MTDQNLHYGKTYLVTGAGRGIGKALVHKLDSLGAKVYALSKNPDNLKTLNEERPNVITICVDVSDWNATRLSLKNLEAVDCVINNAGIVVPSDFFSITPDDVDCMTNVILKAVINVSQIMAQKVIDAGKHGCIVNMSSVGGRKASVSTETVFYACTKAALEMLTKIMAVTLGPHKIRVNAVCPGAVESDLFLEGVEAIKKKGVDGVKTLRAALEQTHYGPVCMPMDDVVNTILFMASNSAPQITGQCLGVDGGLSAA